MARNQGFGERLASLLRQENKAEFAKAIGVRPHVLSRYLAGQVPRPERLEFIARQKGVTVEWLLHGSERPDGASPTTIEALPADLRETISLALGLSRAQIRSIRQYVTILANASQPLQREVMVHVEGAHQRLKEQRTGGGDGLTLQAEDPSMNVHRSESSVVFLLGAGFSGDAGAIAESLATAGYPLVSRLTNACFGLDELPPSKSIEELFQEAIDAKNHEPIEKLCDLIMEADWSLTPHLKPGGLKENNVYLKMLRDFESNPILTFNYDSLVEILLLNLGHWRPEDGYGVRVQVELPRMVKPEGLPWSLPSQSLRPVLHLHGSLCLYTSRTQIEKRPGQQFNMLRPKPEPDFIFDPESLGGCFIPFQGPPPEHTFRYPSERVIAPVPDKAEGLQGEFIKQVSTRAVEILRSTRTIVSIGYSFNPYDQASYEPLLQAARGAQVVLVVPEARDLAARLTREHPEIEWSAVPLTFRDWVLRDYQGVRGFMR
jgi:hypothetical protein